MRGPLASAVIGMIIAVSGCASQYGHEAATLPPETRVRVWHDNSCCANPLVGDLVAYDADSLRMRAVGDGKVVALPWISIGSIERSHRASRTVAGLAIGFVAGSVTGIVAGVSTACRNCDGDWRGFGAVVGGAAGAVLGTLAGAVVGTNIPHEVWERVPLEIPSARSTETDPKLP